MCSAFSAFVGVVCADFRARVRIFFLRQETLRGATATFAVLGECPAVGMRGMRRSVFVVVAARAVRTIVFRLGSLDDGIFFYRFRSNYSVCLCLLSVLDSEKCG